MSQPNAGMDLRHFLSHVEEVQERMRADGVVTVYVQHDILTPYNVRATMEDVAVAAVPQVGAILDHPYAGFDGAPARWRVARVEELASGTGVILHCTDAPPATPSPIRTFHP